MMKASDLIASTHPGRANPMIWEGEEAAEGVFLGVAADDPLAVLGTPAMELPPAPRLPDDFAPSPRLRDWLQSLRRGLQAAANGRPATALDPLAVLAEIDRQAVVEILGSGEVRGHVTLDGVDYRVTESLLPGIWRLQGSDGSDTVEVGELPAPILRAAASLESAAYALPAPSGDLMNAPAVLAEVRDRARQYADRDANHVMNFTLMPMSEADHAALRDTLGRAELALDSGGFGKCRVFATRYRHIWAVQYLNALDAIILDSLEIGAAPDAVRASREDFEDSAARYDAILEAYLP